MDIRKSIGKLPVWKAAILLFLLLTSCLGLVEELFISRVFHIFDRSINHFEKIFNEESKEVDRDYQNFNEQQEFDQAEWNILNYEFLPNGTYQEQICRYKNTNKRLVNLSNLPYVKHNPYKAELINKKIIDNNQIIRDAIAKGNFDPAKCKDES